MYQGLDSCHSSVVQFVTIKNQLLAAGDDHEIKFWDMDKKELLMTRDTGGELPVSSCVAIFLFREKRKYFGQWCGGAKKKIIINK